MKNKSFHKKTFIEEINLGQLRMSLKVVFTYVIPLCIFSESLWKSSQSPQFFLIFYKFFFKNYEIPPWISYLLLDFEFEIPVGNLNTTTSQSPHTWHLLVWFSSSYEAFPLNVKSSMELNQNIMLNQNNLWRLQIIWNFHFFVVVVVVVVFLNAPDI